MKLSQLSLIVYALLGSQSVHAAALRHERTVDKRASTRPATYTVPSALKVDQARADAIAATKSGFTYGPPVAGGPAYPAGTVGSKMAADDLTDLQSEYNVAASMAQADANGAINAGNAGTYDDLTSLDAYTNLYKGQWKNILPNGPAPGSLTNYTQDLFFSMERLSTSPNAVRRLIPTTDSLAFAVDDATAQKVTGSTLQALFSAGRLFYVDHSNQASLARSTTSFVPACDAYFYIDEKSGSFLPLAIRTGIGADLIYTPADAANDWLLAKIMFNTNDLFFSQFNHLAATHEVVQIAWMAAIRSISTQHPVYGIVERLMYQVFGVQPTAEKLLFAEGATVDRIFGVTGRAAQDFTTSLYLNGSGAFQSNYFLENLRKRGLVDSAAGPKLRNFPFYEDALVVYTSIEKFFTAFVGAYYKTDADVKADSEIQAWAKEANGDAKAIDFPTSIDTKASLVAILTHLGHLVSSAHHAVNTNTLASHTMTLPFHPAALWKAPPTAKGVTNVVEYLPPFDKVTSQMVAAGAFARPLLADTTRSLLHMFADVDLLSRVVSEVYNAAAYFRREMEAFSTTVKARTFDSTGLSQGMPFVWQVLDPNVAPYSVTI